MSMTMPCVSPQHSKIVCSERKRNPILFRWFFVATLLVWTRTAKAPPPYSPSKATIALCSYFFSTSSMQMSPCRTIHVYVCVCRFSFAFYRVAFRVSSSKAPHFFAVYFAFDVRFGLSARWYCETISIGDTAVERWHDAIHVLCLYVRTTRAYNTIHFQAFIQLVASDECQFFVRFSSMARRRQCCRRRSLWIL